MAREDHSQYKVQHIYFKGSSKSINLEQLEELISIFRYLSLDLSRALVAEEELSFLITKNHILDKIVNIKLSLNTPSEFSANLLGHFVKLAANLTFIDISICHLDSKKLIPISSAIAENKTISDLNLSIDISSTRGITLLANSIKLNNTIQNLTVKLNHIHLSHNYSKEKVYNFILESLKSNYSLTFFSMITKDDFYYSFSAEINSILRRNSEIHNFIKQAFDQADNFETILTGGFSLSDLKKAINSGINLTKIINNKDATIDSINFFKDYLLDYCEREILYDYHKNPGEKSLSDISSVISLAPRGEFHDFPELCDDYMLNDIISSHDMTEYEEYQHMGENLEHN